MKKQWKRLAALSSAVVMAAATLLYFPSDTLQSISWGIKASAEDTGTGTESGSQTWTEGVLTWTLTADGTMTISGKGAMKNYFSNSPAYNNCDSVKEVVIENGITSIGDYAFKDCSNLASIDIPSSVTSIGNCAFSNCTGLTSITIPTSVTSIGDDAFYETAWLKAKQKDNPLVVVNGILIDVSACSGDIKIPDDVTSIKNRMFYLCTNITSITIPTSVTSIGNYAFCGCRRLTSIMIPKSVTSIGDHAFYGCDNLTVYLEDGSALTNNDLGVDEDKILSYQSWTESDGLTWTLTANGTLTISGEGAMKDYKEGESPSFQNKDSIKKAVIEDGVTSIGDHAFFQCSNLTSVTIPNGVTSIGVYVFNQCKNLTNIEIPDGVTSIGYFTFGLCTNLTKIIIPGSVVKIGNYAFHSCEKLVDVTISDGVKYMGHGVFYNCSSLKSITIPSSVIGVEDSAFQNCSNLTEISVACDSTLTSDAFGDASEKVKYRHSLVKTNAKDATYTEVGNVEYWTCENCKKYFLSDETDAEAAEAVELSATVKPILVQVATATTPIKCVYGQDMDEIDLQDYVENADAVGEVSVKVATGSTMLDGMQLDGSKLSGKPTKVYTDGKEVTFTLTAKNGNTADLTLRFLVDKADPTVEVTVDGDTHTEGDLVSALKLILSKNSTKGTVKIVSEIKALAAGKNTLTWEFTPEDSENYHSAKGTVIVNAQTTTTTTTSITKASTTTTTSKTTATTKESAATSETTATTKESATTSETTATTKASAATSETTATTKASATTSETTATTKESATTSETTATTKESAATSKTTATTKASAATDGTTATTKASVTTDGTTATTKASATTGETTATTKASAATSETTATTKESVTTGGTTATTKASAATGGTTATTKESVTTGGTTATSQTTSATTNSVSSAAESGTETSATQTTITTVTDTATSLTTTSVTTDVTNIADEDLCSWAINDYQKKTGVTPANAEITARSEEACEITLTDENGNVLDVYTVDPKTGTGTNASNAEVNLPQTGNNAMTNWFLCAGAVLFMAFGFGAVKASGVLKRKEDA